MASKKHLRHDLFDEQGDSIPPLLGQSEKCAGCDGMIDMRIPGWGYLADRSYVHKGEACWREAEKRYLERNP